MRGGAQAVDQFSNGLGRIHFTESLRQLLTQRHRLFGIIQSARKGRKGRGRRSAGEGAGHSRSRVWLNVAGCKEPAELGLKFARSECPGDVRRRLLPLRNLARIGGGDLDDGRVKASSREPCICTAIIAIDEFEIALFSFVGGQVPTDFFREVVPGRRRLVDDRVIRC